MECKWCKRIGFVPDGKKTGGKEISIYVRLNLKSPCLKDKVHCHLSDGKDPPRRAAVTPKLERCPFQQMIREGKFEQAVCICNSPSYNSDYECIFQTETKSDTKHYNTERYLTKRHHSPSREKPTMTLSCSQCEVHPRSREINRTGGIESNYVHESTPLYKTHPNCSNMKSRCCLQRLACWHCPYH